MLFECHCVDEILAKLATVRRKAKLDADLSILCHQKDVAAAEAEVNALRSSVDNESITEFNNQKAQSINEADRQEMTQQYVQQQVEQHQQVQKSLNPEAPPYNPHNDNQITSEFTRFLLKKDRQSILRSASNFAFLLTVANLARISSSSNFACSFKISFCFSTNSSRAWAASALACLRASVDDLADKLDEF
jgi:hypothetical protein